MTRKNEFQRITLFLAILAAVFCACYCILTIADKYYSARSRLDLHMQELKGWDACRKTTPAVFRENADAVNYCLENLRAAQQNFWSNLSETQLIGLLALAGAGGASGGYFGTWTILFLGGSAIFRGIKWLLPSHTASPKREEPIRDV